MSNITISIIVPAHNAEKYIEKCLNSIVNQSYKELEIIVIDDGSHDSTADICRNFINCSKRFTLIEQNNMGTVAARKRGLEVASGELVGFVDADDWIETNMYQDLFDEWEHNGHPDIVTSGMIFEKNGEIDNQFDGIDVGLYNRDFIETNIAKGFVKKIDNFDFRILTSVCPKLIKKSVALKAIEKIDERVKIGEDGLFVAFLLSQAESILVTKKLYYHYIVKDGTQNSTFSGDTYKSLLQLKKCIDSQLGDLTYEYNLKMQISEYVKEYIVNVTKKLFNIDIDDNIYIIPYEKIKPHSRVIIYGAGRVGKQYYHQLTKGNYVQVVAWTDKNAASMRINSDLFMSLDESLDKDFDYIIIAINDLVIRDEVKKDLIGIGVKSTIII